MSSLEKKKKDKTQFKLMNNWFLENMVLNLTLIFILFLNRKQNKK